MLNQKFYKKGVEKIVHNDGSVKYCSFAIYKVRGVFGIWYKHKYYCKYDTIGKETIFSLKDADNHYYCTYYNTDIEKAKIILEECVEKYNNALQKDYDRKEANRKEIFL